LTIGRATPGNIAASDEPGGNTIVLVQRAAERHVDQLATAADAEHRLAGLDEFVQQLQFVDVARTVARPFGAGRRLVVGLRGNVGAALQHQAVEVAGVMAQRDITGVK
jgi:hypothetical protein